MTTDEMNNYVTCVNLLHITRNEYCVRLVAVN